METKNQAHVEEAELPALLVAMDEYKDRIIVKYAAQVMVLVFLRTAEMINGLWPEVDSEVGAITAAVHERAAFTLTFPNGETKDISLGEHASCSKGAVSLADRKHPVRHLVAVSQELRTNGSVGRTMLLRYHREEAWATLVSFLGLPADPTWADHILRNVEGKKRIAEIDGIGCRPVVISATTEEVLEWIGDGLRSQALSFPEENGPAHGPNMTGLI